MPVVTYSHETMHCSQWFDQVAKKFDGVAAIEVLRISDAFAYKGIVFFRQLRNTPRAAVAEMFAEARPPISLVWLDTIEETMGFMFQTDVEEHPKVVRAPPAAPPACQHHPGPHPTAAILCRLVQGTSTPRLPFSAGRATAAAICLAGQAAEEAGRVACRA